MEGLNPSGGQIKKPPEAYPLRTTSSTQCLPSTVNTVNTVDSVNIFNWRQKLWKINLILGLQEEYSLQF